MFPCRFASSRWVRWQEIGGHRSFAKARDGCDKEFAVRTYIMIAMRQSRASIHDLQIRHLHRPQARNEKLLWRGPQENRGFYQSSCTLVASRIARLQDDEQCTITYRSCSFNKPHEDDGAIFASPNLFWWSMKGHRGDFKRWFERLFTVECDCPRELALKR